MRLDKFLKVSRIIKRRTLAKEVSDAGRIQVNGRVAKSSTKVDVDDIITIEFGNKIVSVKVLQLLDSTKKEDARNMFEIVEEKRQDQFAIITIIFYNLQVSNEEGDKNEKTTINYGDVRASFYIKRL